MGSAVKRLVLLSMLAAPAITPAGAQAVARFEPPYPTAQALLDSLEAAELRFFYEWREAFKLGQLGRRPLRAVWISAIDVMTECTSWLDRHETRIANAAWKGRILSGSSTFSVCPSWILGDALPNDEHYGIDTGLPADLRPGTRRARQSLLDAFAYAAEALPGNDWIAGQRVRLLMDQDDHDAALDAANACDGTPGWCGMLRAYVRSRRHETIAGETALDAALDAMAADERCRWSDIAVLLDSAGRDAYDRIPCARRDSVDAVIWWLSDPLWSEPGNERRLEQYVRRTLLALRDRPHRDERWDWRPEMGGDALRELILRYGWPSYTDWPGPINDRARTGRYLISHWRGAVNPPYTTFEYSVDRAHMVPDWQTIRAPLQATTGAWQLHSPDSIVPLGAARTDSTAASAPERERATSIQQEVMLLIDSWWWPREHFASRFPIVQLPDGQTVMLRRNAGALLGVATPLPSETLHRHRGARVEPALVVTPRPAAVDVAARKPGVVGEPVVFVASIPGEQTLIGVEIPADSATGAPAARSRRGIAPPPPLSAMGADETAISGLVLLRAEPGSTFPAATEDVLEHMAATDTIDSRTSFGIYWETYGVAAADTVELAVWVERFTPQGILRRFGISLNITADLNTPIAVSWVEPGAGNRAHVIPGRVPIVGRHLVLDAGQLAPGDYWLDVVVRKRGADPLRARRQITVVQ